MRENYDENNLNSVEQAQLKTELTKLKAEKDNLLSSNRLYKSIFNLTPEAIVILDKKGKIIEINNRLNEWLGYDREDVIGRYMLSMEFIPPQSKAKIVKNFTQRLLGKSIPAYLLDFETIDGEIITGKIRAETIVDKNNKTEGVIVLIENITQLLKGEHARHQSEVKFKKLTELAASAIFIVQNKKFVYINPAGEKILGYNSNVLKNKSLLKLIAPEYKSVANQIAIELFRQKKSLHNLEMCLVTNTDDRKFVIFSASPIDYNDKPAILGTAFDVTQQKQNDEKVKSYTEELKNLNANKDKFFSIIAHDLKSPFSALLGYSDFLVEDFDELSEEEIREYSQNINTVAKNVYELLENLLEWSRIQTGRRKFHPEKVLLHDSAAKVIELFRDTALNKSITLSAEIDEETEVYADMNMLFTVLRNLVSNAIKFTPDGGKVTIKSKTIGNHVNISVADTGVGIRKADIEKLFKITTSYSTVGTAQETGTGLGLILCKELVEKNEGTISVSSEEGKGSQFTFTLPLP
ncbi:MAG: hypothetical protein SCALA702_21100 [Melioribacteraceae bacterium]|nr:MAG: hypothetical protein SCALA702_21100 [Melioribacteraceae bacterium]